MSGINLQKRVETVGISLAKRNITVTPKVRVGLALDVSGSTHHLYTNGVMQETIDRLLAVAVKFDDNGELDMWSFDNRSSTLPQATANSYGNYVPQNILNNNSIQKWGGTSYAPVIKDVTRYYFPSGPVTQVQEAAKGLFGKLFGSKPAPAPTPAPATTAATAEPAMVLFITDGANDDQSAAMAALREAANSPVYWQMVGVGPASYFTFIKEAADKLPNVGFINLNSLSMTDEQLYEQLISDEFCAWVKQR